MIIMEDWTHLPSIVIVEILSYLTVHERLKASTVCKPWRGCLFYPSLWRKTIVRFQPNQNQAAVFKGGNVVNSVRNLTVVFDNSSYDEQNYTDCLKFLDSLCYNVNLRKLTLRLAPCTHSQPTKYDATRSEAIIKSLLTSVKNFQHVAFSPQDVLGEAMAANISLLAENHENSLESLHVQTICCCQQNLTNLCDMYPTVHQFTKLRILGLDYESLTNELLNGFANDQRVPLAKLIINVHGEIKDEWEEIDDNTWLNLVKYAPHLEVTLNFLFSSEDSMLDMLSPNMPLTVMRSFFGALQDTVVEFILQHNSKTLRTFTVVESFFKEDSTPYHMQGLGYSLVMLAWRCQNMKHLTLTGLAISNVNIVGIARLRGKQIETFAIPDCCIFELEQNEQDEEVQVFGATDDLIQEVSKAIDRDWTPLEDWEVPECNAIPSSEDRKCIGTPSRLSYWNCLLDDQKWEETENESHSK